jgi:hypothetical protein
MSAMSASAGPARAMRSTQSARRLRPLMIDRDNAVQSAKTSRSWNRRESSATAGPKYLEQMVATPLFLHRRRGVGLTSAGMVLREEIGRSA